MSKINKLMKRMVAGIMAAALVVTMGAFGTITAKAENGVYEVRYQFLCGSDVAEGETVTFNGITYGKGAKYETSADADGTFTAISAPERTGYTFVKWTTTNNGADTAYTAGESYKIDATVTLFAQWTKNPVNNPTEDTTTSNDATFYVLHCLETSSVGLESDDISKYVTVGTGKVSATAETTNTTMITTQPTDDAQKAAVANALSGTTANPEEYKIQWYRIIKENDGWHVDGRLVRTNGASIANETFYADAIFYIRNSGSQRPTGTTDNTQAKYTEILKGTIKLPVSPIAETDENTQVVEAMISADTIDSLSVKLGDKGVDWYRITNVAGVWHVDGEYVQNKYEFNEHDSEGVEAIYYSVAWGELQTLYTTDATATINNIATKYVDQKIVFYVKEKDGYGNFVFNSEGTQNNYYTLDEIREKRSGFNARTDEAATLGCTKGFFFSGAGDRVITIKGKAISVAPETPNTTPDTIPETPSTTPTTPSTSTTTTTDSTTTTTTPAATVTEAAVVTPEVTTVIVDETTPLAAAPTANLVNTTNNNTAATDAVTADNAAVADNTTILDDQTPLASGKDETVAEDTTSIEDEATPLAAQEDGCWIHWLIFLLTIVFGAYNVVRAYVRHKENADETEQQEA